MTNLVLRNDGKLGNIAKGPGGGSSSMETESKCQVSNVSFKNLTAAFANAAEGQGHSFSPGILLSVSSFSYSVSSPRSNKSNPVFRDLRNMMWRRLADLFCFQREKLLKVSPAEGKAMN